jgi:hypothetical protein
MKKLLLVSTILLNSLNYAHAEFINEHARLQLKPSPNGTLQLVNFSLSSPLSYAIIGKLYIPDAQKFKDRNQIPVDVFYNISNYPVQWLETKNYNTWLAKNNQLDGKANFALQGDLTVYLDGTLYKCPKLAILHLTLPQDKAQKRWIIFSNVRGQDNTEGLYSTITNYKDKTPDTEAVLLCQKNNTKSQQKLYLHGSDTEDSVVFISTQRDFWKN